MKNLNLIVAMVLGSLTVAHAQDYYKHPNPLFSKRPDPAQSVHHLTGFGPVGMSLDLMKPNFIIKVKAIEPGSPAEKTGKLKPGMIIHAINGEALADIDPRIQLGNMITQAEAADGRMRMVVSDEPDGATREVVVKLQALGRYSETWPLNCPKSDRIVRRFADYLTQPDSNKGFADIGMLFLLSTGDDKYLPTVRDWAREVAKQKAGGYGWSIGYGRLALAEYYLRTGDRAVLPAIQATADHAVTMENFGGWANKGALGSPTYGGGGGHLNASGALVPAFLFLARECGATIDDETLLRVLGHWYRYAGRGNVPYGNGRPERGYTDNGKNGKLAFSMAAAAALTPDGENSVYARARDTCALFSFYSTSYMLHGHTGGGIGEIWRSSAMGLLHDKRPALYRDFMDQRRWHYEMSRKHDGTFRILGGERYDNVEWGAGYALTYTVPRRTLRITGAPPTKFSRPYQLPKRPWGTAEDDDFESIESIAHPDGTRPDFSKDILELGGGMAMLRIAAGKMADEQLHKYIRHPQLTARTYFADQIVQRGEGFVLGLLRDDDARLRRLALDAVAGSKGKLMTSGIFHRIIAVISDPAESWFVKDRALQLTGSASADQVAPHIDAILPYLRHEEWWLQNAALTAVTPVATDERCYRKVLPAMGRLLETNRLYNVLGPLRWGALPDALRDAPPPVAALAKKELKEAYTSYVKFEHALPSVESRVNQTMNEEMARTLVKLPGGFDMLFDITQQLYPDRALPYEALYLEADPELFSPKLKQAVGEIIRTRLIPRYLAKSRSYLMRERVNEEIKWNFYYREPRVEGLVRLYHRIGVNDYDWHDFGPDMAKMTWHYHSFDPPEKQPWDDPRRDRRYRPVTVPKGMEDWHKPAFDPAKHGWKLGGQPFGATNGRLAGATIDGSRTSTRPGKCAHDFCRHDMPMKTLWEKEAMLLRGTFKFPVFREGYRYRMVMGGMSHVGAGEGFKVYLNGKAFFERERGVGRREGALPISKHIDRAWWPEFEGGEVDLAVISFMNIHRGVKHRHFTLWVQEMKLPDLDDERLILSATVMPMTSAEWQALQDPDDNDKDPDAGKYRWDGKFVDNPGLIGQWRAVRVVKTPDAFDPSARPDGRGIQLKEIAFKANGRTGNPLRVYSGDTLMDLHHNQALKMTARTIGGTEYLFVESGGFHEKHGPQWKCTLHVMKRK